MEIIKDLFSVGILNPNLRVFDIVMTTEYGTSYNSYLVRDPEGFILIDTVHDSYSDIFFKNIEAVTNLQYLKYLIVNHCEPDHSGSIKKLIEINPEIEIYCTQASSVFLKEITNNKNLKIHVVQDQEELKVATHTFKFHLAPFLHWPDSMFTLLDKKALFTCDFLGSHYCEPTLDDHHIVYLDAYQKSLKNYFDAIFGPFKPYVLKGLKIVQDLQPELVCPSHGPVLHKDCLLVKNMDQYHKWASVKADDNFFPIFYVSAYHNTEKMALEIAKQAEKHGLKPQVFNIIEHPMGELTNLLNSCKQFAIGSPTINRNALPPIWNLLSGIDAINMKGTKCLLFGSYGWSGEGIDLLGKYLTNLGIQVSDQSFKWRFTPSKEDFDKVKNMIINFIK